MIAFLRILAYTIVMASTSAQAHICYMATDQISSSHQQDIRVFIDTIQSQISQRILNAKYSENRKNCQHATFFIAIKTGSISGIYKLFGKVKILTSLSSKHDVIEYRKKHPNHIFSAIYTDVSPLNNIAMIKSMFPRNSRFLYLRQKLDEASDFNDIKSISKKMGVNLIGGVFDDKNSLFEVIQWHEKSDDIDGVVIDNQINLNRETLINLIKFCYHKRIFLVGASPSIAKSGALISSYSTLPDHAKHIGESMYNFINYGAHLSDEYPKYFAVDINYNLARSFNLHVPEKIDAYNKIQLVLNKYIDGGKYVAVR